MIAYLEVADIVGLINSNGLKSFVRNEILFDGRFSRKARPDDGNEHDLDG